MCVSVSPGMKVQMSDTVLYAAEAQPNGTVVHVLGYQNKVGNHSGGLGRRLAGWLKKTRRTGNAMILPFPAVPGTMTAANVLATEKCPEILQDIATAIPKPQPKFLSRGGRVKGLDDAPAVQVFATGIYTVVLARDARSIPAALPEIPEEKRPALNPDLFSAYALWYPEWTIALCCFNNTKAALATPLLWWYEPTVPDRLFLPALDCHTGAVPDLGASVLVNHTIAVGSPCAEDGHLVFYRDVIPAQVRPYLCKRVIGGHYHEKMTNGDFVCRIEDVRAGQFHPERSKPPGSYTTAAYQPV